MPLTSNSDKANTPKRSSRSSFTMRRTNDWVVATDVPTDIVVNASGTSFSLHKFPLVAKSGLIRKLVAEAKDSDSCQANLIDIPGGAEAFELAIKFCYGINFEITISNVAILRCIGEYLEMTDDYAEKNLVMRTETFLNEIGTQSLTSVIHVLHTCENLLPMAEELKIVSRCIDAAASRACLDQVAPKVSRGEFSSFGPMNGKLDNGVPKLGRPQTVSWVEELSILRLDFYQRVLAAMRSRGVRHECLWETLVHYAQCSIKGLNRKQVAGLDSTMQAKVHDSSTSLEHEQRILVETLVSLLPSERQTSSCSFLFSLLRTATMLDTTVACRLDLERRIGMQLEQASLDDLLIPSFLYNGDTIFDVDLVHRLVMSFLQQQENEEFHVPQGGMYDSDEVGSPSQATTLKVGKLLDSYLAEVAPDANLKLNKFAGLAELLPEYSRMADDGLYRAIDIYLKAHPTLNDLDRKRLCKLMDPQKLSQEACTHAAQNERLHVQFMVQVLYFEQVRLRAALANSLGEPEQLGKFSNRINSGHASTAASPRDNYAFLRRENRELKLELARMRARLSDLEKDHVRMKQEIEKPTVIVSNKIFQAVSKKLGRLNPFVRNIAKEQKHTNTPDSTRSRRARHSIS